MVLVAIQSINCVKHFLARDLNSAVLHYTPECFSTLLNSLSTDWVAASYAAALLQLAQAQYHSVGRNDNRSASSQ
jgi:hypothetical protein